MCTDLPLQTGKQDTDFKSIKYIWSKKVCCLCLHVFIHLCLFKELETFAELSTENIFSFVQLKNTYIYCYMRDHKFCEWYRCLAGSCPHSGRQIFLNQIFLNTADSGFRGRSRFWVQWDVCTVCSPVLGQHSSLIPLFHLSLVLWILLQPLVLLFPMLYCRPNSQNIFFKENLRSWAWNNFFNF